jgi:uncharacterized repeat protein (TIGR03803 family)
MIGKRIFGVVRLTASGGAAGLGTIFRMTPDGTTTPLHSFTDGLPFTSYRALVQARDGNLYGITPHGGSLGLGAVFRMTPDGTVCADWKVVDTGAAAAAPAK